MNDKTRIRIKVPAHLYESVKKQLMIKEGKGNFSGGAYTETVKEKKSESSPKSSPSAPKSTSSKPASSKLEGETEEKTLEERMKSLEEMVREIVKAVKPKQESEKDQSYIAGKQDKKIEEKEKEKDKDEEENEEE